jgi:hypothetical protein
MALTRGREATSYPDPRPAAFRPPRTPAASVQHQLVSVEPEAGRDERANPLGAPGHLEDAVACAAVEVVMVLRARRLISGRFALVEQ